MKKSFLFISCEEAYHICDKHQYGEATPWERFKLGLRLSWCHISQAYSKKNRALTKAINTSNIRALSQKELEVFQSNFQQHLKNQG